MKLNKVCSLGVFIFCLSTQFTGTFVYAQTSAFVPDEIIVHFKDGVIDFPVNSGRRLLSETNILIPQIRDSLASISALEVGRVFRRAIPHDTLKVIRPGKRIRIADAS